ncbi:MAG TPA: AAA family ATPase, partial [Polyangiaceae bacterium]|nr:AAA family ATPase [Polyangiaceae bacterium]
MRLARLDLISWGHFARASLDLSAPGLQLVYGPNEAGKSTARRAITALLFGVPRGTPDAFLLPKATDARVGGRVVGDDGEALELVRRGGQKNTLLTPRDEVLSEEPLARLVGVGEATFSAVFSMDHDTLRQGAEAVLRVGGDVGESLAAAALGDARLSKAAARLRIREGELYNPSPNARKSQLHEALRAYKEARQRVDDAESDPAAYDEQRSHARARRDAHEAALQRLAATRAQRLRLEEVQRARPVVRERDAADVRLAELAHVPTLRGGLEQEHSSIAQSRRQAEGGLEVVAARRVTLREREAAQAGAAIRWQLQHQRLVALARPEALDGPGDEAG